MKGNNRQKPMVRTPRILLCCVVCFLAIISIAGCQGPDETISSEFPVRVIGDVEKPLALESLEQAPETTSIEHRDAAIDAVPLGKLLEESSPRAESFDILLEGDDGLSAVISNEDLTESYITHNKEYGWEAINFNHPISSNIKEMRNIVVIAEEIPWGEGFSIIETDSNLLNLSIGELYKDGYSVEPRYRGSASVTDSGQELAATTYHRERTVNLERYIDFSDRGEIFVIGKKGEVEKFHQDGVLLFDQNSLSYAAGDEVKIEQAVGMVLDPPERMIADVHHHAKKMLQEEQRVLLVLIDGLGYHQYEYAVANGYAAFLASLPEPEKAMVAYPPVTPVNVAASLTGELPHVNGIYRRGIRQLEVPTMFGFTEEQGIKGVAVIGDIQAVEKEITPIMCSDETGDGSTDYEKTEAALAEMEKAPELMFVHYKDVDVYGHDYGDMATETMEAIEWNDELVEKIVTEWEGKVIIYADHGMHETEEGGDHKHLRYEDMFMPYWLFDTRELD